MNKPAKVASERDRMAQAALIAAGSMMQGGYRPDSSAQATRVVRLANEILDAWLAFGEPKAPAVEG